MAGTCVEEVSVGVTVMANHEKTAQEKIRALVGLAKKQGKQNSCAVASSDLSRIAEWYNLTAERAVDFLLEEWKRSWPFRDEFKAFETNH